MGICYENVSYHYRSSFDGKLYQALSGVNLKINKEGEIVAILGKTGSGKTTLFELANAMLKPTKGHLNILGVKFPKGRFQKLNHIRRKVGLSFQFPEYQLFRDTVIKDIAFGPSNFKETKKDANILANHAFKLMRLPNHLKKKSPFEISGGEMRKVAIAGILALNPDILLLDEPTRGLDVVSQKEIITALIKKHNEDKKTICLITHDIDLAYFIATRIVVLKDGKIVYDGKKEDLVKNNNFNSFGIAKPSIITIQEALVKKYNFKINYDIFKYEDLKDYLKEVIV